MREHLRQNLDMMRPAARGREFTVTYKRRWIAADALRAARETKSVLIALTNPPYRDVVPLRIARLLDTREDDAIVAFQVRLEGLVEPETRVLSDAIRRRDPEGSLPKCFVMPLPDAVAIRTSEDEAASWRTVADHVRRHEDYSNSCLLRLEGYEIGGRSVRARDGTPSVPMGRSIEVVIESRNDHLDPEDLAELRLLADSDAWTQEGEGLLPSMGLARLSIRPEEEDRPSIALRIGVRPRWADSSVLEVEIPVLAENEQAVFPDGSEPAASETRSSVGFHTQDHLVPPGAAPIRPVVRDVTTKVSEDGVALRAVDLHRLLNALKRSGPPELSIVEDHLLRWMPGDPRLEEERIRLLVNAGRLDDAARRYEELEPATRTGIDPWLRFQACAQARDTEGVLSALKDLAEFGDEQLDVVVGSLARIGDSGQLDALDLLAEHLLGEQTLVSLLRKTAASTDSPRIIRKIAELLDANDLSEEALRLLDRQLSIGFDEETAAAALELASRTPGRQAIGDWALRLVEIALEREGPEKAVEVVRALKNDLRTGQRYEMYEVVIPRVESLGSISAELESLAKELIAAARFDEAAGLAAVLGEVDDTIAEYLVTEIDDGLRRLESVREFLQTNEEHRRRRAAGAARDKHLILVGGERIDGFTEELRETYGFGEIVWLAGEYGKEVPLEKVASARPESHVVVIITDHVGHSVTGKAEDLCRKGGVTPHRCPQWGKSSIDRTILDALAPPR